MEHTSVSVFGETADSQAQAASCFFSCPVCGRPLSHREGDGACRCSRGHSFDIASEGYVHLLPSNQKHSKIPGDTKEMVASRRRFLEAGGYELFSRELNRLAAECLKEAPVPLLLDTGCGEGYYTGRMAGCFREKDLPVKVIGYDISKFAVKAAAKRYRDLADFAVASSFAVPLRDNASGCTVNVFAPIVPEELRRVTAPGGFLLLAVPSPNHLFGLKKVLYDAPYKNIRKDTNYPGFRFLKRLAVEGALCLSDPSLIEDLFRMTPYYWKTPQEGGNRLRRLSSLQTEIGFDFLLYRREREEGKERG